jgi:hypothetical protein
VIHQIQNYACAIIQLHACFRIAKYYNISLDWLDSLGRKVHIRLKRQARYGGRFRGKRKEIRILSERERENFFDAVNALKKDRVSDKQI